MTKELTAAVFDYSVVDKDTKGKLLCIVREITQAKKQHTASGMLIGEAIAQAHSLLAVDGRDGKFSEWVESECGFARSTAYNYMNAWQRFGNCPTVGQFDAGALYALASPQAPEKAAKEAEKLADKGVKITLDRAKELLGKFREVNDKPKGKGKTSAPKKPYVDPIEAACEHDYDDEACRKCHAPKPVEQKAASPSQQTTKQSSDSDESTDAGPLFSKLLEHLRQSTLLLDQINKVVKNDTLRQEIFTSLEVANTDIIKWRKSAKSRR